MITELLLRVHSFLAKMENSSPNDPYEQLYFACDKIVNYQLERLSLKKRLKLEARIEQYDEYFELDRFEIFKLKSIYWKHDGETF
jgi:hypothetical protein